MQDPTATSPAHKCVQTIDPLLCGSLFFHPSLMLYI